MLDLVKGLPEHGIMSFLAVEQEVDGLLDFFVVDLPVQVFINHLGPLL